MGTPRGIETGETATARINPEQKRLLNLRAKEENTTASRIMNKLIREYLARHYPGAAV